MSGNATNAVTRIKCVESNDRVILSPEILRIPFMGSAAFVFAHDLTLMLGMLATPLTIPVVNGVILPFYHRLPITTGYEYLERRFNVALRSSASILFILLRLFYLAVVIYAPPLALALVT